MSEISGIHHVSLTVTDIEASVPWYIEVLGLTKLMEEKHYGGAPGYGVVLGLPDWSFCIGLHVHPANESETFAETRTGLDHVGLLVANRSALDEWKARFTELGVAHSPITDEDYGSVLVFRDPDGIQLELMAFA